MEPVVFVVTLLWSYFCIFCFYFALFLFANGIKVQLINMTVCILIYLFQFSTLRIVIITFHWRKFLIRKIEICYTQIIVPKYSSLQKEVKNGIYFLIIIQTMNSNLVNCTIKKKEIKRRFLSPKTKFRAEMQFAEFHKDTHMVRSTVK